MKSPYRLYFIHLCLSAVLLSCVKLNCYVFVGAGASLIKFVYRNKEDKDESCVVSLYMRDALSCSIRSPGCLIVVVVLITV